MGCCGKEDKKVNDIEVKEIKEAAVEFEGPVAERSCRDVIFLIIFLAFLGGMGYVSFLGIHQGNPYRIVYGVDSWGNVCNQKNDKIEGVPLSGKDMSNRPGCSCHKRSDFYEKGYFLRHFLREYIIKHQPRSDIFTLTLAATLVNHGHS